MKKDKQWLLILVVGSLLLVALGIFYYTNYGKIGQRDANQSQTLSTSNLENRALELNSQQLPDFKITSPDGRELLISSFSDKPLLIVEWASWCPDCRNQLPIIQKMYEKYGNQVHFVLINLIEPEKETTETADRYITQGEYTFPYYYDMDQSAADALQVQTIPSMYFVDKQGQIKKVLVEHTSEDALEKELKELLQ